ncbi:MULTISPECIES: beta-ketoacyl synthase N-terminal-like domain-containing protein [Amycolatopsis]|uniref:Beta-ketoacyl synthase N-terminal-like domain-containing protein n=1 Tax=Amycolatopsis albidoflavus TaxID=102226 RepID=A0ABW5I6N3_9PSEU
MGVLAITGFGVVSPAGATAAELAGAVAAGRSTARAVEWPEVTLPTGTAHHLPEFSARAELGRRGTGFFDRRTGLAVVACGRAIEDAGLDIGEDGHRTGLVLGTTVGSAQAAVDYAAETFTEDPPYLVNPALFPNTVLNGAAGQAAIRFGLRGVNATVAGGPVALLSSLRYSANVFRTGQADVLLAGAVEEFTPHSAWLWAGLGGAGAPGEGAAVFVLRPAESLGHRPDAEILATAAGFCPSGEDRVYALADCARRALEQARVGAESVRTVASASGADEVAGWRARTELEGLLGVEGAEHLAAGELAGNSPSATPAVELALILARHRAEPARDGQIALLVASSPAGAVAAAVVRGWSRGDDRG